MPVGHQPFQWVKDVTQNVNIKPKQSKAMYTYMSYKWDSLRAIRIVNRIYQNLTHYYVSGNKPLIQL